MAGYDKDKFKKEQAKLKAELSQRMVELAENYNQRPELLGEYLQFQSKFYQYSTKNQMMMYAQNPHLTFVSSYGDWKEKGYNVLKGSKGLKIFVPVTVTFFQDAEGKLCKISDATKEQKEAIKRGEIKTKKSTSFKLGTVFDISQTNCPVEDYPKIFDMGYHDRQSDVLFQSIKKYGEQKLGYAISVSDVESIRLRGSCNHFNKIINISDKLQDTQALSTLTQELGHAVLHEDYMRIDQNGDTKSLSQIELEADCFSILLSDKLGVELTPSRKLHLSDHYKAFMKEIEPTATTFEKLFNNVNKTFRMHWEGIQEYIEKDTVFDSNLHQLSEQARDVGIYEELRFDTSFYHATNRLNSKPFYSNVAELLETDEYHEAFIKSNSNEKSEWIKDVSNHLYNCYLKAADDFSLKGSLPEQVSVLQMQHYDTLRYKRFVSLEYLQDQGSEPNGDEYDLIYCTTMEEYDNANSFYERLNDGSLHPSNYYGHSLSMSDVIVITNAEGKTECYYVDDVGLSSLKDDFLTKELQKKIKNQFTIKQEYDLYQRLEHNELMTLEIGSRISYLTENFQEMFERKEKQAKEEKLSEGDMRDSVSVTELPTHVADITKNNHIYEEKMDPSTGYPIIQVNAITDETALSFSLDGKLSVQANLGSIVNHSELQKWSNLGIPLVCETYQYDGKPISYSSLEYVKDYREELCKIIYTPVSPEAIEKGTTSGIPKYYFHPRFLNNQLVDRTPYAIVTQVDYMMSELEKISPEFSLSEYYEKNKPMTFEKFLSLRDTYLTEENLQDLIDKNNWQMPVKEVMDVLYYPDENGIPYPNPAKEPLESFHWLKEGTPNQNDSIKPEETLSDVVSYYVAECSDYIEYVDIPKQKQGEYQDGLSFKEAYALFEKIPSERMDGRKEIGFHIQKGERKYSFPIIKENQIDFTILSTVQEFCENNHIEKAADVCKNELKQIYDLFESGNGYHLEGYELILEKSNLSFYVEETAVAGGEQHTNISTIQEALKIHHQLQSNTPYDYEYCELGFHITHPQCGEFTQAFITDNTIDLLTVQNTEAFYKSDFFHPLQESFDQLRETLQKKEEYNDYNLIDLPEGSGSFVRFTYSEWDDNRLKDNSIMKLKDAEQLIGDIEQELYEKRMLDPDNVSLKGYFKTDFEILNPDKSILYEGRYDMGDEYEGGSIIKHIEGLWESQYQYELKMGEMAPNEYENKTKELHGFTKDLWNEIEKQWIEEYLNQDITPENKENIKNCISNIKGREKNYELHGKAGKDDVTVPSTPSTFAKKGITNTLSLLDVAKNGKEGLWKNTIQVEMS